MAANDPLVLVDGSSYLYRAFHALPPLITSKGMPTGAIKGVINMLRRLQKDYPDSVITVIFDAKGKTFRDEIYTAYKANRAAMPDDLRPQVAPIHQIVEAMGLPLLVVDGVEADDVIGTLAEQATQKSIPVVISTGDKDMAQLVNEHVSLVNTMTELSMDPQGVVDKFGIPAKYIIDYLALMGDKVDNIPGVPGVGEKTALGLIQTLGSIEDIYNKLDQVADVPVRGAKKLAEKLAAHEAEARLSYTLATIKLDVELEVTAETLYNNELSSPPNTERLNELFNEFEFKSWAAQSGGVAPSVSSKAPSSVSSKDSSATADVGAEKNQAPKPAVTRHYETVLTAKRLGIWIKTLAASDYFSLDTETTSLNYIDARVVGVSVSVAAGSAAYIPFAHHYEDAPEQLTEDEVLGALKPLLENPAVKKVGQNLKYDKHVLSNHGIDLQGIADDTMLMSYVLNSTSSRHDMDSLASNYLDESTTKYEEVAGKGAKQITFDQVDLEIAGPYAAEDADITLRLHEVLKKELAAVPSLEKLYREIELPLLNTICDIEQTGTLIEGEILLKQSAEIGIRLEALAQEAYTLAEEEFNLGSPKQLQTILFEKLKLPVIKKTPKGQPSTAEPILQELALNYPLPKVIMEYRGLSKLKSTYTDRLPEQINAKTGRVHTSYHQAVTATGRLSSSDPNLQNIPIRTAEGRKVRQAFIASPNNSVLAADYSQIELRIMAHLSGDKGLLDAFNKGLDVHKATAAEVFSVNLAEVSQEQRRRAKAINFGLIYGMSAFGLAKQLDIGRRDAQEYIDRYFDRYPGVLTYMENTRAAAYEMGYVETLFGRRLHLPEINSSNGMRRQAAERTAINAPMQGTAADIIKIAMLNVNAWLKDNADIKMIMQVHDELVFEVPTDKLDYAKENIGQLMSNAADLAIPLVVDIGVGDNWDEAH
ncbi:MAG: DNA polymerase I [Cellvibrionales bacterium]|nr:DNA polymerase I [Cellvibrionales bacterium]